MILLQATLKPKWWNSTSSVDLQITVLKTGDPVFMAQYAAGPVFTADYTAPAGGTTSNDIGTTSSTDSNVTQVNNLAGAKSGGISKGAIAAAVLIPLIVIGIGLGIYIRLSRAREAEKRKRWSENVDKRMSTISGDWRSMSRVGAEAAIRASVVDTYRNSVRASVAGGSLPRPSSTFAVEGAGDEVSQPPMAQIRRPGVGPRGPISSTAGSDRVSRVSFAADTRFSRASTGDGLGSRGRPSVDSRRAGVPSRAFHSAYIPPVPLPSRRSEFIPDSEHNSGSDNEDARIGAMSPTQREGPLSLSAADIHARMNGTQGNEPRPSIDEVYPALSMMRMQNGSQADLLLEPGQTQAHGYVDSQSVALPPPATPKSPIMEAMPMQPLPSSFMSPDEMLRNYAERRRTGTSTATNGSIGSPAISYPMPVASPVSSTSNMRTLFSPTGTSSPTIAPATNNPFRKSMATDERPPRRSAETQYDDDDAYLGTN